MNNPKNIIGVQFLIFCKTRSVKSTYKAGHWNILIGINRTLASWHLYRILLRMC